MRSTSDEFLELMQDPSRIRNIGIISHVDHGKTTLSDHLLEIGHLIAPSLAGISRSLDYLDEEQERGITIEVSVVTFPVKINENEYGVLNLVDTPGHVDFSGKVTEALRLVDGAIVLVDAVEGVMAQTETVLIQAIEERIPVILVINKLDRLILELRYDDTKIQETLTSIINEVNVILNAHHSKQTLSFSKGNVLFGSALHGWFIGIEETINDGVTMTYIREAIERGHNELKKFRAGQVLVKYVFKHLPSPIEAVHLKFPKRLKHGDSKEILNRTLDYLKRGNNSVVAIGVTGKTQVIRGTKYNTVRILCGQFKVTDKVLDVNTGRQSRIDQLALFRGNKIQSIKEAYSGMIIGFVTQAIITPGDTLVSPPEEKITYVEPVHYIQEPVIWQSIEPKNLKDLSKLPNVVKEIVEVTPNLEFEIDKETGEYKLIGIGTLQLELAIKEIEKRGIPLYASKPHVRRYEIPEEFVFFEHEHLAGIKMNGYIGLKEKMKDILSKEEIREHYTLVLDLQNENQVYIHKGVLSRLSLEALDGIKDASSIALNYGPLKREKVKKTVVMISSLLTDKRLSYELVLVGAKSFIHLGLTQAKIHLYEPVFEVVVRLPKKYLGEALAVLGQQGATIEDVIDQGQYSRIIAFIQVSKLSVLPQELRGISEGRAFLIAKPKGLIPIDEEA